jgi:hypothetical protein
MAQTITRKFEVYQLKAYKPAINEAGELVAQTLYDGEALEVAMNDTQANDFTEQERAEWEHVKEAHAKMKEELSDLKVKYANLYFAGTDDNQLPKSYNEPKPTTLKDILG